MNTNELIKKHEAAITHLEAIETIRYRFATNISDYHKFKKAGINSEWTLKRAKINEAILKRITESYKRLY